MPLATVSFVKLRKISINVDYLVTEKDHIASTWERKGYATSKVTEEKVLQ